MVVFLFWQFYFNALFVCNLSLICTGAFVSIFIQRGFQLCYWVVANAVFHHFGQFYTSLIERAFLFQEHCGVLFSKVLDMHSINDFFTASFQFPSVGVPGNIIQSYDHLQLCNLVTKDQGKLFRVS